MPIYEYECKQCKKRTAELRSIDRREEPLECPHCGGEAVVVLSTFAQGRGSEGGFSTQGQSGCSSGFS